MELNLQHQKITINETIFHATVEQPIECDALLPDYCPDIVKILKCGAAVHVESSVTSGSHLTIEGMVVAHIYYTTEQNMIRHTEYKIPFAKQVDLRDATENPIVTITPSVNYINCRAVNQRRIDVRGAISLAVKVTDQREQQFISDAVGGGLQLRQDIVPVTDVMGQARRTFPLIEELELGFGKNQIGHIIRTDSRVHLQDHKVVSGKVVVKGDFLLHILYQPLDEGRNPEVMEFALPISQIVDCDAATEDCICDVEMFVVACDVRPEPDDNGEQRIFSLDARLGASVTVYLHRDLPVATDSYSTKFETGAKRAPVNFVRLVDNLREKIHHKTTLDLPEGIDSVLDAWSNIDSMTWKHEDESLILDFKLTVSMFARMENRECLYFEQGCDISHTVSLGVRCAELQFDPTCDIISCNYSLTGTEKIDLRFEVMLKGCVHCTVKMEALSDISLNPEKVRRKEQNKLYIYYAHQGESVWSIAKQYNTSASAIWDENNLEDDALPEKMMLLIPIL